MATLTLSPASAPAGSAVTAKGTGYPKSKPYTITASGKTVAGGTTDAYGSFTTSFPAPATGGTITASVTLRTSASATLTIAADSPPAFPHATPDSLPRTFFDDFRGTSVDWSKWGTGMGHYRVPASLIQDRTFYDQIAIGPDGLELSVRKVNGAWRGGLIDTAGSGRFSQRYGWFGVQCKMPSPAKGLFAAPLWMYGYQTGEQEIDVLEVLLNPPGTNNKNYPGYPYGDATLAHFHTGRVQPLRGYRYHAPSGDFSAGFHTFEVDWRATYLRWYVDGVLRAEVTDQSLIPNLPLNIVLNLTIGGDWAGAPDPAFVGPAKTTTRQVWATA